jgi:flagellar hook-length control protein FliK
MLAPMLKTSAHQAQAGLPGGSQPLQGRHDGQDFNQIFNQQHEQPLRERADNRDKKEVTGKGQNNSEERSTAKPLADTAPHTEKPGVDQSGQIKEEAESQEIKLVVPDAINNQHDLLIAETSLDENTSWSFWLQFAQDAALSSLEPSATADTQGPKLPDALSQGDEEITLLAPIMPAPVQAEGASLEPNAPFTPLQSALAAERTTQLKIFWPVLSGNETGADKALNTLPDALIATVDTPEDKSFTGLLAANLTNLLVKPQAEVAKSTGELPLLAEVSVDAGRLEPAIQPGIHDSKWLGQAEQTSNSAAATAVENKSFLQLRFNQQTLASDLVEKTGWLIEHKLDTAHIQLDPPELGPIAVKIHSHQEQVSVSFVVANPQVREAMDQTLQRLKDLLQEQGINLSHADVNDQRQQRDKPEQESQPSFAAGESLEENDVRIINLPQNALGVDHFV